MRAVELLLRFLVSVGLFLIARRKDFDATRCAAAPQGGRPLPSELSTFVSVLQLDACASFGAPLLPSLGRDFFPHSRAVNQSRHLPPLFFLVGARPLPFTAVIPCCQAAAETGGFDVCGASATVEMRKPRRGRRERATVPEGTSTRSASSESLRQQNIREREKKGGAVFF